MNRFFLVTTVVFISALGFSQVHQNEYVEGEVLVLLSPKQNAQSWLEVLRKSSDNEDIQLIDRLSVTLNLWRISFSSVTDTKEMLQVIETQPGVQLAQLNHTQLVLRDVPDDPLFPLQWSLENTGTNGGSGTSDVQALDAWNITTGGVTASGDTIVVAIIDGGFNITHEDLEANIFVNRNEIPGNGIDDDGNGYIDDVSGWNAYTNTGTQSVGNHGTHVAGIVGAKGNNDIGVSGVNWNVKLLPISGSSTLESTVVTAYSYALDMRRLYNQTNGEFGAYVVATNSSFGVDYGDPAEFPIWCAMYDSLGLAGVISAGATANLNINVDVANDVPTACGSNFLISVTNTTSTDVRNQGAAYGLTTIDLGAPGTSIHSTTLNGYGNLTGTSMATPHVAGSVALMYSAICPDILAAFASNPAGLAMYVRTSLLTQGVDEVETLDGLVATGGRLNLFKAVKSMVDTCLRVVFDASMSDCGICNGSISAQVLGGSGSISYLWSNGGTTSMISGLCAGQYTLTVSSAEGDTLIASTTVSELGGPALTAELEDAGCFGASDGEITLSGADDYIWSDGVLGASRIELPAGLYTVSATSSSNACITVATYELNEPSALEVEFISTIPLPYLAGNGQLEALVSGGFSPYFFSWSTGDVSSVISGLTIGDYTVEITDAHGCTREFEHYLGYPLGEDVLNQQSFNVFPNPTRGILYVTGVSIDARYFIVDMMGRRILEGSIDEGTIDVHELSQGMYQLQIIAGEKLGISRILVEK